MNILYSFGKGEPEGTWWRDEIGATSTQQVRFYPFNHSGYLSWHETADAVALDRAYHAGHPGVHRLQNDLERALDECNADALFVTNAPPYHPDFLRGIKQYKVLYSTDDPGATYQRTIPYLHAYDHVMFCAPGYSSEMSLKEKLLYAGARRADWLPLGVFDYERTPLEMCDENERDLDIVYVGACYKQKLPILAAIKRVFGKRARINGWFKFSHNAYLVLRHGYPGWVTSVSFQERLALYRRAKIGFNIHWNQHGLGNQRLYHLPANGVLQISDCPELLNMIFDVDNEIVGYESLEDLLDLCRHYLAREDERRAIAQAGRARVERDYLLPAVNARAAALIASGMSNASH